MRETALLYFESVSKIQEIALTATLTHLECAETLVTLLSFFLAAVHHLMRYKLFKTHTVALALEESC